ncbi:phosphatidylinositol N-acetylglucosaminyltransferase [Pneumocystis jirovecii RU7]|uniref:N-acetylglucosaminyl transferase component Gpi1 n=1 Tax=Pneumocystis jirovecii (strain RU7) TaxID=1408657 RepID=A0A0W4ZHU5_PNEJ7|nr:phosphatidylinositol N-acetylglucosaminyltransferase [Pneumocystis jirovecii RU7]KTW27938.1 hypothetical protein T551_02905 [Pneumocystis jirovecii RU7]
MFQDLIRIYWPVDIIQYKDSGLLIGFQNSQNDIFIVTSISNIEKEILEKRIQNMFLKNRKSSNIIEKLCDNQYPKIIGALHSTSNNYKCVFNYENIWINAILDKNTKFPQFYGEENFLKTIQVILYYSPNFYKMQYYSLKPIGLELKDKVSTKIKYFKDDHIKKSELQERLKKHVFYYKPLKNSELYFSENILKQINKIRELSIILKNIIKDQLKYNNKTPSLSTRIQKNTNYYFKKSYLHLFQFLSNVIFWIMLIQKAISETILYIIEWKLCYKWISLKDISATVQQIDMRLQQFCYWPIQYQALLNRKKEYPNVTKSYPNYIRFYNNIWLITNDIIFGIIFGSYLIENKQRLIQSINYISNVYTIESLHNMIFWLMNWPGGLKLNSELAGFLGNLFLWLLNIWKGWITIINSYLPIFIQIAAISSFMGFSLFVSFLNDALSLLTLHIHIFYTTSTLIYNWQLTILISLFHLFRGKKKNILRNRIDSCDYDIDQLVLGTILFTLFAFLFPTILAFYFTFALVRIIIIIIKAILDTTLTFANHFPLFAIMLRIKDPFRLPGGIRFELMDFKPSNQLQFSLKPIQTSYIFLKSTPLSLESMFCQYSRLAQRLKCHYFSKQVIINLVRGIIIPPIPREKLYSLQYSMLPENRISIMELIKINSNQ